MKGTFKFHPVGHGQFYTGKIQSKETGREINFIYDIGTKGKRSIIDDEVKRYCDNIEKVDFVILSHLDIDHVKGLYTLLNSGIRIESVIMPYLLPKHIKLLKRKAIYESIDQFEDDSTALLEDYPLFEFIFTFYMDPYAYIADEFHNLECKTLIYSTGNISEFETLNGKSFYLENLYKTDHLLLNSFINSDYMVKAARNNVYYIHPRKSTKIAYRGWVFDLKQPGFDLKHKEAIDKIHEEILAGLLSSNDNEKKESIKKAKHYIDNSDCITLEHYPLDLNTEIDHTLLTGDFDEDKIYDMKKGLLSYEKKYYLIQMPHHGSKLPKEITAVAKSEYAVVCHNIGDNNHPHPSTETIFAKSSNKPIQHVTLDNDSYFEYEYDDTVASNGNSMHFRATHEQQKTSTITSTTIQQDVKGN